MPAMPHEVLVNLFKCRPELAAEILSEVLGVSLPDYMYNSLNEAARWRQR